MNQVKRKRKKIISGWTIQQNQVLIVRIWSDLTPVEIDDYTSISCHRRPSARRRWLRVVASLVNQG